MLLISPYVVVPAQVPELCMRYLGCDNNTKPNINCSIRRPDSYLRDKEHIERDKTFRELEFDNLLCRTNHKIVKFNLTTKTQVKKHK